MKKRTPLKRLGLTQHTLRNLDASLSREQLGRVAGGTEVPQSQHWGNSYYSFC